MKNYLKMISDRINKFKDMIGSSNREMISPIPNQEAFKSMLPNREQLKKQGWVDANPVVIGGDKPVSRPTPSPTPAPTKPNNYAFPEITPMPTQETGENPYADLIKKTWRGVNPAVVNNVMFGESSFRPNLGHLNSTQANVIIESPEQLRQLMAENPSMDLGLMQINTAKAMGDYLKSKGLNWYDLMDPETNMKIAYDLYIGNIPYTAPGMQNWMAAKSQGIV